MRTINQILLVFREKVKCEKDKHLANYLGIKPNTISTWKKRGKVPYKELIAICEEKGIDLNWLFFGQEIEQPQTKMEQEILEEIKRFPFGEQAEILTDLRRKPTQEQQQRGLGKKKSNERKSGGRL